MLLSEGELSQALVDHRQIVPQLGGDLLVGWIHPLVIGNRLLIQCLLVTRLTGRNIARLALRIGQRLQCTCQHRQLRRVALRLITHRRQRRSCRSERLVHASLCQQRSGMIVDERGQLGGA